MHCLLLNYDSSLSLRNKYDINLDSFLKIRYFMHKLFHSLRLSCASSSNSKICEHYCGCWCPGAKAISIHFAVFSFDNRTQRIGTSWDLTVRRMSAWRIKVLSLMDMVFLHDIENILDEFDLAWICRNRKLIKNDIYGHQMLQSTAISFIYRMFSPLRK